MSNTQIRWIAALAALVLPALPMHAVDGVVLINQAAALAGNVTPGDTAGFPVTISAAGSYRLSGNLTVPDANTTAIEVMADNVTIDLNGFSIIGPTVCSGVPVTSCSPAGSGVGVDTGFSFGAAISNGIIRGMGGFAINSGETARVKEIRASNNGLGGIINADGVVESSEAFLNGGGVGIEASSSIGNTAEFNAGVGIIVFAIALNSTAFRNQGDGIETGLTATVSGNFARDNGGAGINAGCPSSIVSNTLSGNTGGDIVTRGTGCVRANNAPAP